jgi:hypothetical protein
VVEKLCSHFLFQEKLKSLTCIHFRSFPQRPSRRLPGQPANSRFIIGKQSNIILFQRGYFRFPGDLASKDRLCIPAPVIGSAIPALSPARRLLPEMSFS